MKILAHFHNCHSITDTIYIYKKLLNVHYRLIKDKRIEIPTLLRAGFKKTKVSKQLNISRMPVNRVEQHLKAWIVIGQEDLRL